MNPFLRACWLLIAGSQCTLLFGAEIEWQVNPALPRPGQSFTVRLADGHGLAGAKILAFRNGVLISQKDETSHQVERADSAAYVFVVQGTVNGESTAAARVVTVTSDSAIETTALRLDDEAEDVRATVLAKRVAELLNATRVREAIRMEETAAKLATAIREALSRQASEAEPGKVRHEIITALRPIIDATEGYSPDYWREYLNSYISKAIKDAGYDTKKSVADVREAWSAVADGLGAAPKKREELRKAAVDYLQSIGFSPQGDRSGAAPFRKRHRLFHHH